MDFHLVTAPFIEFIDTDRSNLALVFSPNLINLEDRNPFDLSVHRQRLTNEDKRYIKYKVDKLRNRILPVLASSLNTVHGVEFSSEYWEILLGPWLHTSVNNTFLRLDSFQLARKLGPISSMCLIDSLRSNQVAQDTTEFFELILNLEWINARDWRISQYLDLEVSAKSISLNLKSMQAGFVPHSSRSIASVMKGHLQKISVLSNKLNSGFFLATYMPSSTEYKTQLLLGQLPTANRSLSWKESTMIKKVDGDIRRIFTANIRTAEFYGDDKFILTEVSEQMPAVFLEHYNGVRRKCLKALPKNPIFVFTSNSFHQDELFKFWIAEKKTTGTKYLIGQHGNNYGANDLTTPTHEERTCSQFLTWGWRNPDSRYVPSIVFKTAGLKRNTRESGGLLLLSTNVPNGHSAWDESVEYYDQLKQQHEFVDKLDEHVKSEITIRIPQLNSRIGDHMPNAWTKEPIDFSLDLGVEPYLRVRSNYRLAVFSYDSTGLLEGLVSNVPTMAFWLDGLSHLNDFARAKYQILVDAGIIFLNSTDCSSKINEVWEDVGGWWKGKTIQEAREMFCANFCEYSNSPARDIAKSIKKAISHNHR